MSYKPLTSQLFDMVAAKALHSDSVIKRWEVSDWLIYGSVPPEFAHFEKAIVAQEIMNSPLYKALEEE